MGREDLVKLIESDDEAFFVGKLTDDKIEFCEKSLNVILPESFKWFLKEYGTGGMNGVEIIGGGLAQVPSCVESTKDWRQYGLPNKLVIVEDNGEWQYCLNTEKMKDGECPVVDWEQGAGIGEKKYSNFYEFLIQRFS